MLPSIEVRCKREARQQTHSNENHRNFTPLIFTGCTLYPWASLSAIKWFQVLTLLNPLTYASEGLRYAMIPPVQGQAPQTLAIGWVLLALGVAFIGCLWGGIRLFKRRVVS